jgi:hypothetical protein
MKAGAFMRSTCEKCSRTPATLIKSTKNLGLLWTHKTFRVQALLCRECAVRQLTADLIFTAVLGWWSVVSLFANIAFVADDLAALSAARKMAAPAVSVAAAGEASP